jgi:tripartite-type tricarboxylate transporter receptor subunit TctC
MHTINRRQFSALCTATLVSGAANAQSRRPELARIYVPFAAGGGMDQIARLLAETTRGELADNVIVENKSGASGRIAVDALKLMPADGTTLLVHASVVQSLYPFVFKQLSYDALTDLSPVSVVARIEYAFAVGPGVPQEVRTLAEYLAWLKADPKRSSFATPGAGTPLHLMPLLLQRDTKVEMNPVHYRGTSAGLPEVMGGSVPAIYGPLPDLLQQVAGGRLRLLATSGPARNRLTPTVPTFAEQGYPELTMTDWYGIFVNGKTPQPVQEAISLQIRKALTHPVLVAAFEKAYLEPYGSTPAEAMRMVRQDSERFAKLVKTVGYQPE